MYIYKYIYERKDWTYEYCSPNTLILMILSVFWLMREAEISTHLAAHLQFKREQRENNYGI